MVVAVGLVLTGCGGGADVVAVPDVVGLRLDAADEALDAVDLRMDAETVGGESIWDFDNWEVVASTPEAGAEVDAGSEVALRVDRPAGWGDDDEPVEPVPVTDEAKLQVAVVNAVGDRGTVEWNEGTGTVTVRWEIDSNLTQGLTKASARLDATTLLEELRDSGVAWSGAILRGSHSLVDELGNESMSEVVNAVYQRDLVDQINFEQFDRENVWAIADGGGAWVHPAFVED